MKIEIGESLFYSWLRHVKECQIVQTNWKISSKWDLKCDEQLTYLMNYIDEFFFEKYSYRIFKNNSSLGQLLGQAECDVLGISIKPEETKLYAVDVAFHEAGLNYGPREITILKVVEKCVRMAFCLYGYLDNNNAEIIFTSPKINPAVLNDLLPCFEDLNRIFKEKGLNYEFKLIANEEYNESVLKPILTMSDDVADTAELFMRSYQMFRMFNKFKAENTRTARTQTEKTTTSRIRAEQPIVDSSFDEYKDKKIGKLAQEVLMQMLIDGKASEEEIMLMQKANYSKQTFDLQFPLLVPIDSKFDTVRYYSRILNIYGKKYRMCSQWYEVPANNDRSYLLSWIAKHKD